MDPTKLRKRALLMLSVGLVMLLAVGSADAVASTETFGYTGGEQTFTVPAGVTSLGVLAIGGQGGSSESADGGVAAEVSGVLSVSPGETLYVEVAGNGRDAAAGGEAGFNGGGASGNVPKSGGGGGGGASDVRTAPQSSGLAPDARLIVAAGSGGAGGSCYTGSPGGAGGAAGENGENGSCGNGGGTAGTSSSGGTGTGAGDCGTGQAGELGIGGSGSGSGYAGPGSTQKFCEQSAGGGGGGGLYGGAGGSGGDSNAGGGGGGGSSLVPSGGSEGLASPSMEPQVQITYATPVLQQQAKLTATGESGAGKLGKSVSVSADGSTAIVGAPADNGSVGAAFVYTRSGATWTQQAKLTATGETGAGQFGERVSISSDGNTVVVGAPEDNGKVGAAFVFTRSGSTWTQQSKLTGTGESGKATFGSSVAISTDASTISVGAPVNNGSNGAVWVYTRSGSTWIEQAKLTPSDEIGKGKFGTSVALSSNGNASVIGASADNINAGAAFIFARSGTSWSEQTKLTASGEEGEGHLGTSVALSASGTTALVGAPEEHALTGAAYVFIGSGSSWTQQTKLTATGEVGTGHFGQSVALSSDGNKGLVGAYGDENAVGAAYQFERSGSSWSQLARLTASGESGMGQLGNVSLSSDASTALIGASADNSGVGAAFVFVIPTAVPTITGVSPTEGPETGGSSVTITGTNLSAVNSVKFGSTSATSFTVNSATSITATAPAGSGTMDVTASNSSSTSATSAADKYSYIAAPTVSALNPTSGPAGGGTSVTITGTNLSGATSVKFGSINATSFTVNAENSITATSPAGSGVVDVTITTAGGTSATSSADHFSYLPTVTGVSPGSGPAGGGTTVTITGTNFSGATAVKFGASNANSFTVNSATSITATSPAGSNTVDVTVTTPGGTSATTAADHFSYIAEPPPTVTKVKPNKGRAAGGTTVTITGSGFLGAISVKFGSTAATSFVVNSDSQVKAVAPAGTGTVNITVTTPHGTSATTSADQFTYQAEQPTITKLSPTHGPTAGGTTVTVTGTNFATGSGMTFKFAAVAGVNANCTSTTSCTVVAPAAKKGKAGTVDVVASVGKAKSKKVSTDKYTYE